MSLVVVDLNDAGIIAASASRSEPASPGYALLRDNQASLGIDAYRQARLYPRETNHKFWHELSTEPVSLPHDTLRSRADLAYAHLKSILQPFESDLSSVVFAVPGSFSKTQLGLLLGLAKGLGVVTKGLVDAGLAAVSHPVPGEHMLVLDMTLHSTVLTKLDVSNGLHRTNVVQVDNIGLCDFTRRWANCIGDAFVKNSRFDPMHSAQSEQWLYDHMAEHLQKINAGAAHIDIVSEDGEYKTRIERNLLVSAVTGLYQPIITAVMAQLHTGTVTTVLLTGRTAALPGLRALLEENDSLRVKDLDNDAVVSNILSDPQTFMASGDGMALQVQRPWQATPSLVPMPEFSDASALGGIDSASHVLIDDSVYRIDASSFLLGTSLPQGQWGFQINGPVKGISRVHCALTRSHGQLILEDRSTYGIFVNGKRVATQQVLHAGDIIQLGNPGVTIKAIRQVQNSGTH